MKRKFSCVRRGVCLTVLDKSETAFIADVMPESMMRTSLAALRLHSKVNLELALRSDSRLGGAFCSWTCGWGWKNRKNPKR
nr:hypothetical protein [Streptococcus agalactiae]